MREFLIEAMAKPQKTEGTALIFRLANSERHEREVVLRQPAFQRRAKNLPHRRRGGQKNQAL